MSDCPFRKELTEYPFDLHIIDDKMHELEKNLGYAFRDIRNLANAMCGKRLSSSATGPNNKDYYNNSLALVGDCILKSILAEELFRRGLCKGDITEFKKGLEGNETLLRLSDGLELKKYVFNENGFLPHIKPGKEPPPYSNHNQYLEAIIGSVFFDSDYETCRSWVLNRFYPSDKLDERIKQWSQLSLLTL